VVALIEVLVMMCNLWERCSCFQECILWKKTDAKKTLCCKKHL